MAERSRHGDHHSEHHGEHHHGHKHHHHHHHHHHDEESRTRRHKDGDERTSRRTTMRQGSHAGEHGLLTRQTTGGFDCSAIHDVDGMLMFWQEPAFLASWCPAPFEISKVHYKNAEQFTLACKARMFGDVDSVRYIMSADDPVEAKLLAQSIAGYNAGEWDAYSAQVAVHGNYAKFMQNETLKRQLLSTGDKELVLACPSDTEWGIGWRADAPGARDRTQWLGDNKLGQSLMIVRTLIREGERPSPALPPRMLKCEGDSMMVLPGSLGA